MLSVGCYLVHWVLFLQIFRLLSKYFQLVDVDTLEDIDEPNVIGELWVKGPTVFKVSYFINYAHWIDRIIEFYSILKPKTRWAQNTLTCFSFRVTITIHKRPNKVSQMMAGSKREICSIEIKTISTHLLIDWSCCSNIEIIR